MPERRRKCNRRTALERRSVSERGLWYGCNDGQILVPASSKRSERQKRMQEDARHKQNVGAAKWIPSATTYQSPCA